jgi:hypothetical protein
MRSASFFALTLENLFSGTVNAYTYLADTEMDLEGKQNDEKTGLHFNTGDAADRVDEHRP